MRRSSDTQSGKECSIDVTSVANWRISSSPIRVTIDTTGFESATPNNAPDRTGEPVGDLGTVLSVQARTLDSRLRVAVQAERRAARRAASHVVQLARRIARLLPRVPTLLPTLPDHRRDSRVRHYVLHTVPMSETGRTRLLTLSTESVLRFGELASVQAGVIWSEYNPLEPPAGWDLELVLERLGRVLAEIQVHVEDAESHAASRTARLQALISESKLSARVARVSVNHPSLLPVTHTPTVSPSEELGEPDINAAPELELSEDADEVPSIFLSPAPAEDAAISPAEQKFAPPANDRRNGKLFAHLHS